MNPPTETIEEPYFGWRDFSHAADCERSEWESSEEPLA